MVEQCGIVSVQVLNELASVAHRKLKMSWQEVASALGAIRILCPSVVTMTAETHDAALRLAVRDGFHVHDALIVAAALEAGCGTLCSEDMQSGQVIGGRLTIRRPFAAQPLRRGESPLAPGCLHRPRVPPGPRR
jgi:predicted nucleic acid-binding protein